MSRKKDLQRLIRHYKSVTGETEVDMKKVAMLARDMGWPMPEPKDPLDILAKQLSTAAREEYRKDKRTGRPYRANHALAIQQGAETLHLWIDIDEAPRSQIVKSLTMRREQMVSDGLQLTYDADHWNANNPDQKPIQLEMDFTLDIEWRKNSEDDEDAAA